MGALSIWHWLIVLAVVLLLFGSKKLPDAARGLGRSMRIFKSEIKEMQNDDKPVGPEEPQALTQAGQPNAAQYAQPQAPQQPYQQPQAQPQSYPQAPQQPYQQPQAQPQAYPQAPQQPYQQQQGQQGQQPYQPPAPQQPVQPPQHSDPTAPYNGGTGSQGQ